MTKLVKSLNGQESLKINLADKELKSNLQKGNYNVLENQFKQNSN